MLSGFLLWVSRLLDSRGKLSSLWSSGVYCLRNELVRAIWEGTINDSNAVGASLLALAQRKE